MDSEDDAVAGPSNCSNSCATVSNTENPHDLSMAPSTSRKFLSANSFSDEAPVSFDLKDHNRQFEVIYRVSLSHWTFFSCSQLDLIFQTLAQISPKLGILATSPWVQQREGTL